MLSSVQESAPCSIPGNGASLEQDAGRDPQGPGREPVPTAAWPPQTPGGASSDLQLRPGHVCRPGLPPAGRWTKQTQAEQNQAGPEEAVPVAQTGTPQPFGVLSHSAPVPCWRESTSCAWYLHCMVLRAGGAARAGPTARSPEPTLPGSLKPRLQVAVSPPAQEPASAPESA